jgi:branched-chain amino acid transport system substrate-binding protein
MDFLSALVAAGKLKKPLKIALVLENTEHGKDYVPGRARLREGASGRLLHRGRRELRAAIPPDFKPLLTRVAAAKADLFMADAHLEDYISMHRTYTQMGLYHQMVTYGARGADAAGRKALGAATDYIFASGWWSDMLPLPAGQGLQREMEGARPGAIRSGTTRAPTRRSGRSSPPWESRLL